jgi:hypothetical protein
MRKLFIVILVALLAEIGIYIFTITNQNRILQQVVERLTADTRVAEAVVSNVRTDPISGRTYTTVLFREFDTRNAALEQKTFTFSNNIIHFQALVIRFNDNLIKKGDKLKGKSAYIFMKAFSLTDNGAEVFDINKINEVPSGYYISHKISLFERQLWKKFWSYALDSDNAQRHGIKNAQIEAPGTKFYPGILYILKIEHDGGLRIDTQPLPQGKIN